MPLRKGSSEADVSANIAELVRAGHPQKQAEAIAFRVAGKDCAALDMSGEEWNGLLGGLIKFFTEERREPEHAGDAKLTKAEVGFEHPAKGPDHCSECEHYRGDGVCAIVEGSIAPGDWCKRFEAKAAGDAEDPSGKLSETTRKEIGREGSEHREEEPESVFLEPKERKYPVKVKRDGEYKYDRNLLLAAAREARMHGHEDLARRADEIRKREFGSAQDALAFDRDTVREKDADGRLHIKIANISKAAINPYYGREIPNSEGLGLDPNKIYYLLRHPDELKKAAKTFNGIPVQIEHHPTSAADHQTALTVGATGNDAEFAHPFLRNSLVIWPDHAIEGIEDNSKRELSCGYKYDADMTPGEYEGQQYDGVMRNIVGNHVSLVESGRAGPDVVVGDSALGSTATHSLKEMFTMGKHVLTRKAAVAQGAVLAHLKPLLAADAALDIGGVFVGVTSKNMKEKRQSIIDALKPKLKLKSGVAMDAALKAITGALDESEPMEVEEGADTDPNSGLPMSAEEMRKKSEDDHPLLKELEGKISPELMARIKEALGEHKAEDEDKRKEGESDEDYLKRIRAQDAAKAAKDAEPEAGKPAAITKEAMDAAIAAGVTAERKRMTEMHEALQFVEPYVGKITQAHDSAGSVYRAACGMLKLDVKDVKDDGALRHVIAAQPKASDRARNHQPAPMAADAAATKSFNEMFPGADRIGRAA